jgi:hypothetical protein
MKKPRFPVAQFIPTQWYLGGNVAGRLLLGGSVTGFPCLSPIRTRPVAVDAIRQQVS